MKINHFLQLIILFLCILWSSVSSATPLSTAEAEKWANNKGKEVIGILTEEDKELKLEQLDAILLNDIDLAYAARFVMGKYWKQMTEEQKTKYLKIFTDYVRSSYQNYDLQMEKGSINFTVDKVVKDGDVVNVFCSIILEKLEQKIDQLSSGGIKTMFVLVKNEDKIQVRDLKIEESSFLIAYRQRFYKMIHEDSDDEIDWFLNDLETITYDNLR